ncbi:hypothetical protein HRR83_008984 [Exophiala dermatitidis]|uniref:Carboxymuconolactone decarboxylase-like domain-containing protein n=2 Tax=Exophiala dermatitidis TaxID=5970 RepID=H6CBY9_EXODN|nr:uncharacterized protein HMPREF1120_09220 [Exophiala dermatitidis NIH/UT8656]KAJ4503479.1 hypothetical protein HRR73_009104 [Exophiala dermatitidis]EHY61286.1 hypothetical protein HMPREF1120_09220 [Exophiala dermatitidis NIH/UT8656]KAJ4504081.1 hypothetical protein HRR74_009102 [Exophiala dermatitidis]KAJ4528929.1 hypothetical protein HRR76_009545 [Exophiala dermatitidis]KAJ4533154.1 hypothetical protein HRR77_008869 [Exophiala dermatitidis]
MAPSKDPSELKKTFVDQVGEAQWDETWESIAKLSPELFEASVDLLAVPRKKRHLSPKVQQLMSIAVDAASTHLYVPGVRKHIDAALKEGATPAEVIEVIELTGTLGIHACNIGVPLLVEVMKEEGIYEQHPTGGKPFDERREKLKADFTKNRGYWHTFWEDFLALDPEFFEAYLKFSSVPWLKDVDGSGKGGGALEPKVKELVYCAFDAAATHLYVPGLKLHMKNVLKYGGTPEEIMEVLEIATQLSLHTSNVAAPILAQRLNKT